jgi:hypothetical protein
MYIKDINKLKRKMSKECNTIINGIIEQMIANEEILKVSQVDPAAIIQATSLELKMVLTVQPTVGKDFTIGNHRLAIDIK